ncbi:MAG: hypothetical protein AAB074_11695 [Planctomycetota bacterium]
MLSLLKFLLRKPRPAATSVENEILRRLSAKDEVLKEALFAYRRVLVKTRTRPTPSVESTELIHGGLSVSVTRPLASPCQMTRDRRSRRVIEYQLHLDPGPEFVDAVLRLVARAQDGLPLPRRWDPEVLTAEEDSVRSFLRRDEPGVGHRPDAAGVERIAAWLGVPAALVLFRTSGLTVFPPDPVEEIRDCAIRIEAARFEFLKDYLEHVGGFWFTGYRLFGAREIRTLPSGATFLGHGSFGHPLVVLEDDGGRPALFILDEAGAGKTRAADSIRDLLRRAFELRS